jgi:hypothetical protein
MVRFSKELFASANRFVGQNELKPTLPEPFTNKRIEALWIAILTNKDGGGFGPAA